MSDEKSKQDSSAKMGLRRWEELANDLPFSQLERVRSAADKWLTTISALTGLSSLLTLLASGETTAELTELPKIFLGVVLGSAFLSAITAIYLGALAAQGKPTNILNDPLLLRKWYQTEAATAASYLVYSRRFALAAAILVGLASFVAWYGPKKVQKETTAIVTLQSGEVLCQVVTTDANGRIVFDLGTSAGSIQNVSSFELVSECP
jgi:hypothetical protein